MDKIVELPSIKSPTSRHQGLRNLISKAGNETAAQIVQFRARLHAWRMRAAPARTARCHQGLRKLSPDLISKARDETATQVTRIGLTFLGTAAFCLLSLLTPDSSLLGGNEKINVPFAGPVSFLGFMLLGPTVLILLRVYLQIYVEHGERLDRLARSMSAVRAPTLVPLQNSLIRLFSGLIFYILLPVAMLLFAWKAAVFLAWGLGLFGVAVAVIVNHVMLPFGTFSWRSKGMLSICAALIVVAVLYHFELPHRPFNLFRTNLSGQWLFREDLRKANLYGANLSNANLGNANLSGATLLGANLSNANLFNANLSGATLLGADMSNANLLNANLLGANLLGANLSNANLFNANLSGATLFGADLNGADMSRADMSGADVDSAYLSDANLSGATNLTQPQLGGACGNSSTKLPEGFTLSQCSTDR